MICPEKYVKIYSKGKISVSADRKVIHTETNKEVSPVLSDKLVALMRAGAPFSSMEKFLSNLELNPSHESVEQLLIYLGHNKFPITNDGCFLAYKYVTQREDGSLWDAHSGKFNNNPGKIVSMDRSQCNPDRFHTCSSGLHVAAYEYAKECGGGSVLIQVKVNPKDVVAVPNDYHNQKMRVCRYEVISRNHQEIRDEYLRIKKSSESPDTEAQKVSSEEQDVCVKKVDFDQMTGQQIIDHVKEKTGKTIPVSPKSKRSVIRYAEKFLNFDKKVSSFDKVILTGLTGKDIIKEVKKQTGYLIRLNPKSKAAIIKKAVMLLTDHGLEVVY